MITQNNAGDRLERLKKDIRQKFLDLRSGYYRSAADYASRQDYSIAVRIESRGDAYFDYMQIVEETIDQFIILET
jgi:hypothetical protein